MDSSSTRASDDRQKNNRFIHLGIWIRISVQFPSFNHMGGRQELSYNRACVPGTQDSERGFPRVDTEREGPLDRQETGAGRGDAPRLGFGEGGIDAGLHSQEVRVTLPRRSTPQDGRFRTRVREHVERPCVGSVQGNGPEPLGQNPHGGPSGVEELFKLIVHLRGVLVSCLQQELDVGLEDEDERERGYPSRWDESPEDVVFRLKCK